MTDLEKRGLQKKNSFCVSGFFLGDLAFPGFVTLQCEPCYMVPEVFQVLHSHFLNFLPVGKKVCLVYVEFCFSMLLRACVSETITEVVKIKNLSCVDQRIGAAYVC